MVGVPILSSPVSYGKDNQEESSCSTCNSGRVPDSSIVLLDLASAIDGVLETGNEVFALQAQEASIARHRDGTVFDSSYRSDGNRAVHADDSELIVPQMSLPCQVNLWRSGGATCDTLEVYLVPSLANRVSMRDVSRRAAFRCSSDFRLGNCPSDRMRCPHGEPSNCW